MMALHCLRPRVFCLSLCCQKFSTSFSKLQAARPQFRLVEVGKFEPPLLYGQYECGQLFYHRIFGYRGVILFSWQAKLFDKNASPKTKPRSETSDTSKPPQNVVETLDIDKDEGEKGATNTAMSSPLPSSDAPSQDAPSPAPPASPAPPTTDNVTHQQELATDTKLRSYYLVLIDSRDQESVRVRTRSTPVTLEEIENDVISVEGIDHVSHDDVQPYTGTGKNSRPPISHPFFTEFFTLKQEPGEARQCVGSDALMQCRDTIMPALSLSNVYRETTENVRVTVTPFYIGSRSTSISERTKSSIYQLQSLRRVKEYWWLYCIRLENLGEEPVQLRERKWCIYTKKMNTINGRGVVGEEPILSREQPAFQYVSMISLDSPSGHMWGKYKMERLESGAFFDCEIPNFALDSKRKDPA